MESCGAVRCILDTIMRCGYYAAPLSRSYRLSLLLSCNLRTCLLYASEVCCGYPMTSRVLSRPDHVRDMPVRLIDEDNKYAGRE